MGSSRPARAGRIAGAALLALMLGACGDEGADRAGGKTLSPQEDGMKDETSRDAPAGAIKVDEDLYMVPAGRDRKGCRQYTAFSRTGAVAMVIYYRTPDGEFTPDRSQADCD